MWDFVGGAIRRRAGDALAVQLTEMDFLVALPNGEPSTAAARCLHVVREVLGHFLGSENDAHLAMHPLRSMTGGAALGGPAETAAATPMRAGEPESAAAPSLPPPRSAMEAASRSQRSMCTEEVLLGRSAPPQAEFSQPHLLGAPPTSELAGVAGGSPPPRSLVELEQRLGVGGALVLSQNEGASFALRPVWSLKHGAVSSFRLAAGPIRPTLSDAERERIDLALLAQAVGPEGLGFLQQGTFLHLPVAWSTLLTQRGRVNVLNGIGAAREVFRRRVLLEIDGLDSGVLESRLSEVVHFVRPFVRLVLASARGRLPRGALLRSAGVSGLAIDAEALNPANPTQLLAAIAQARRETPVVVAHGLLGGQFDDDALLRAGASHASWRPSDSAQATHRDSFNAGAVELARVSGLIQADQKRRS